jgi:two-component system, chemotaxis family, sensor kinase CheA
MSQPDYSYFDALLDAVFVLNEQRGIVYCNEAAAKLFESSVKRLTKGKPIFEFAEFFDDNSFLTIDGTSGKSEPAPMQEVQFKLVQSGKMGKVQISLQPFKDVSGEPRWIAITRDVTLEEVLHAKHHAQLQQLEAYSKNLEKMVEERTLELQKVNVMLSATMNSLGQGFLVFDSSGTCSNFYTKACEDILESMPALKKIWDVLRVPEKERSTFDMWMKALFSEQLPFESMKSLGPSKYEHTQDRHVRLDYFPLRDDANKIDKVVLVATDWTNEFLAQKALEQEKKFAKMVIKLVTARKQFAGFLSSIAAVIEESRNLANTVQGDWQKFDVETSFRLLHTLEGEAGIYSADTIWLYSRKAQEVIEPVKKGHEPYSENVHVRYIEALNELESMQATFLKTNDELFTLTGVKGAVVIEIQKDQVLKICEHLSKSGVSHDLVQYVKTELLAEKIESSFAHYNDVSQAVAERLNKKVRSIEFHGGDLRIITDRFETLFSTFVHVARNTVDHGIEAPEEREMMGKPPEGSIVFNFKKVVHDNQDWLQIEVQDDGQGIEPERIRRKILEAKPDADLSGQTDHDIIQSVFDPGLTTKAEVGEFSGRGVGLNAVRDAAEQLGGSAVVHSELGKGTRLTVLVPIQTHNSVERKAA